MLPLLQLFVGGLIVGFLILKLWLPLTAKLPAPYPPSPPSDPLIGHIRILDKKRPEIQYAKWCKEYNSNIIYVNLLKMKVIVLNSIPPALAMLEKKGAIYSNRPPFQLFAEQGWIRFLTGTNPGPVFKKHRRLFQNMFTANACIPYQGRQQSESRRTIRRMIENPELWEQHLIQHTTSIIMTITYGISVDDPTGYWFSLSERFLNVFSVAPIGMTSVDFIPAIRKLPTWLRIFPALNFARDYRSLIEEIREETFAQVKKDIENGIAQPSFALNMLQEMRQYTDDVKEEERIDEDDIKGAGVLMFAAGHDTTFSTINSFIVNMIRNPEVQEKAWAEIDSVIGRERLPTFDDRSKLPYINRIVQETLRWGPAAPLGVPHVATEDGIYNGMFIPKGIAFIIANAHAMTHDESLYHDPDAFNPDRYLSKEDGGFEDPLPVGNFGFGRRICPGRHLADASVWIVVVTMLACLEIKKSKDKDGKEITPSTEMTTGATSRPVPFKCSIQPRFPDALQLVS